MRALRPWWEAGLALAALLAFLLSDNWHHALMLAIWPEYRADLPYPGGSMWQLTWRTTVLVVIATLSATALALVMGILATRPRFAAELAPLFRALANSAQAVPALAVLALALPLLGFGAIPTIIALVLYGLLPLLTAVINGIASVAPAQKEAGMGMGMSQLQLLLWVELPEARRAILAGGRTAAVLMTSTAVLGGLVGAGGLGEPIIQGLQLRIPPWIWFGAVPTALLALTLDFVLSRLERIWN